jgi:hypothetical protein
VQIGQPFFGICREIKNLLRRCVCVNNRVFINNRKSGRDGRCVLLCDLNVFHFDLLPAKIVIGDENVIPVGQLTAQILILPAIFVGQGQSGCSVGRLPIQLIRIIDGD